MTTAHIVTIRKAGTVLGHQLRAGGTGPGQTAYFSAVAHGDPEKALRAAKAAARARGLKIGTGRGGSPQGRRTAKSRTPAAGIRWEWHPYYGSVALYVVASWSDKRGRPRQTRYSTEHNGLEAALDLAIKARTSAGAPMPDREALLRALRAEKRAGQQA